MLRGRVQIVIAALAVIVLLSGPSALGALGQEASSSQSWLTEGGDYRHSGQSSGSLQDNWGELDWMYDVASSDGRSNATFDLQHLAVSTDGTVYITDPAKHVLYAVKKGISWTYSPGSEAGGKNISITSPVLGADGSLYLGQSDGFLKVFDATRQESMVIPLDGTIFDPPAVAENGTIYISTSTTEGNSTSGRLYSIAPNGATNWNVTIGDPGKGSIALADNGTVYLITTGPGSAYANTTRYLQAFDGNGSERWSVPLSNNTFHTPAVGQDGTIYLIDGAGWNSTDGYHLWAIGPNGTVIWKFDIAEASPLFTGDLGTAPAISDDGVVYFGAGNSICAVDGNGSLEWIYDVEKGHVSTPAVSKDGTIVFGVQVTTEDYGDVGYVIAMNADGTSKWSYGIVTSALFSDAAIGADGSVYIAVQGTVFSFKGGIPPSYYNLLSYLVVIGLALVAAPLVYTMVRKKGSDL